MIQRHEVLNKIEEILNEVNLQFETLQQFDTDVNVEILNAKIAYLANFSEILRKISVIEKIEGSIEYAMCERKKVVEISTVENKFKTSEKKEPKEPEIRKNEEPEIPEPFLIIKDLDIDKPTEEAAEHFDAIESKSHKETVSITEEPVLEQTEQKSNIDFATLHNIEKLKSQTTQISNIEEKPNSLNDLFAQKHEAVQTVSSASRVSMPIVDLRMAFSLNDRILFIRELFKGYNLAFTDAINVLNEMKSFEEARSYLVENYSIKNEWHEKADTLEQFYSIISKKYTS